MQISRTYKAVIWIGVGATLTAGAAYLYLVDPHQEGRFPSCPFFALTGCYCPGCGTLRALHCLMHGEPVEAVKRNVLAMILLPVAAYGALLDYAGGQPLRLGRRSVVLPSLPHRTPVVLLVVILSYWILRNLPWYPFTLLAPHR